LNTNLGNKGTVSARNTTGKMGVKKETFPLTTNATGKKKSQINPLKSTSMKVHWDPPRLKGKATSGKNPNSKGKPGGWGHKRFLDVKLKKKNNEGCRPKQRGKQGGKGKTTRSVGKKKRVLK